MKSKSIEASNKVKLTDTRKQRFSVFTICLIIAALIWLLIKLSEQYSSTIKYPFEFVNLPDDKVMIEKSDSTLLLEIKIHGFNLISTKYFKKQPILKIDYKKLRTKTINPNTCVRYIETSQLIKKTSSQLKSSSELLSISPDTIFFKFENLIQKKLPIQLNLTINNKQQYHLYSPVKYSPDSVVVKGPYSVVSNLKYVKTKKLSLNNIIADKKFKMDIQKPFNNSFVSLSKSKINVEIDVEEFTEANFEIPVYYVSKNKQTEKINSRIKTFPEKVKVIFLVALKDYKTINKEMFTASIDYEDISAKGNRLLKVELTKFPEKVIISRIEPDVVEYIIIE